MRGTPGIAGRTFRCLGRENINIIAIAQGSSEYNVSFVVEAHAMRDAVRAVHDEFELEHPAALFTDRGTDLVGKLAMTFQDQAEFSFIQPHFLVVLVSVTWVTAPTSSRTFWSRVVKVFGRSCHLVLPDMAIHLTPAIRRLQVTPC